MTDIAAVDAPQKSRVMTREEKKVVFAASLGSVFEWYDFFLYGALSSVIALQFFSAFDPGVRNLFALLAFSVGFLVRPFGALVFGRIGDLVGRKYTFLVTVLMMGIATFCVGILPTSASIGIWAPIILITLRMLQGLAMGGEFSGAVTYVAEYAPPGRRGLYTSWIQTTATLGLLMSLVIIIMTRSYLGEEAFAAWGWRVPFLFSIVLLIFSVWIRLQLNESPVFRRMKEDGTRSKAPLSEAFGQWKNAKLAIIALFGLVAGQGVIWYTGQFYVLFFMQSILKVDGFTVNVLVGWALLLGTMFFVFFGWLSDYVGRKPIIMTGLLLSALTLFPLFGQLTAVANPALDRANNTVQVVVNADPASCGSLFNPVGTRTYTNACDLARDFLAKAAIRYDSAPAAAGAPTTVSVNGVALPFDVAALDKSRSSVTAALKTAGYPIGGDPGIIKVTGVLDIFNAQAGKIIGLLFLMMLLVTMTYGPMSASLVEQFPARIRYTAMSLPSNIGNGWFGGLFPAAAFAMVAQTGDIYFGLWYAVFFAVMTLIIGVLFLPETKDRDINVA
jgi:MFS family permease